MATCGPVAQSPTPALTRALRGTAFATGAAQAALRVADVCRVIAVQDTGDLPLHLFLKSPVYTKSPGDDASVGPLTRLLAAFPNAAGTFNSAGLLPLHVAMGAGWPSLPVLTTLLGAYPEAARTPCKVPPYTWRLLVTDHACPPACPSRPLPHWPL